MTEGSDNLISVISKLNCSYFKYPKEDIPPTLLNKLNKKMINHLFKFSKKFQEIPSVSSEDLHSLIKLKSLSLLPAGGYYNDEDRIIEITDCLAALEKFNNEKNDYEEFNRVLLCLYSLSEILVASKRRSKNLSHSHPNQGSNRNSNTFRIWEDLKGSTPSFFDFQNLNMLYLNMSRFNDVNWEVFRSNKNYESYSADKKLFRIQESTFCDHSICLYRNSFCFNDINWNIFDVAEDYDTHIHHSTSLYLNSSGFNDINWDLLGVKKNVECPDRKKNLQESISFNDVFKYRVWNFDIHRPVEPIMPDEGFITPGSNFSEELSDHTESSDSEILVLSPKVGIDDQETYTKIRFIWEQPGRQRPSKEPEFISGYINGVLDLWKIWNVARQPLTKPVSIGLTISFEEFKVDINHLLAGMASNSFYFAPITRSFHMREKLHIPTVTPEALSNFCETFVECGNNFVTLKNFVDPKLKITECGPVHQAFCNSIRNLLQWHRFCLLHIKWDRIHILLQLEAISLPLKKKLSFVRDLCATYFEKGSFLRGEKLLDHLYESFVNIQKTDYKFLSLYLFESCCNIYLKLVAEWIFNGNFSSPKNYDEFFIQIQHELDVCWDWRRLSYVRVDEKRIPKFLQKFFRDIFICGKSVHLLRIFSRKEVFERILPTKYPSIRCCFNSAQIEAYAIEWERFQNHFYEERNWSVNLKDKFAEDSVDLHEEIKKFRRKKFEDSERNRQKQRGSSVYSNESFENIGEETTTVKHVPTIEVFEKHYTSNNHSAFEASKFNVTLTTDASTVEKETNLTNFGEHQKHIVSESGDGPSNNFFDTSSSSKPSSKLIDSTNLNLGPELTATLPLRVFDAGGDATALPPNTSFPSIEQTEYERNRQKSVTSNLQNQLNMTFEIPQVSDQKFTSTPLNACAQNRLKNMSTTFNDSPMELNIDKVTSMSDCARNRIKVMRSEYHERLSHSNLLDTPRVTELEPCEPKESVKNKLKVMSSEYHLRLNALAVQEDAINCKLITRCTASRLTEQEINKHKVLLEEYHQPLRVNHDLENTIAEIVKEHESSTSAITDESTCSKNGESKSENLVTIIENAGKPSTPDKKEGSCIIQSSRRNRNVFCVEQYTTDSGLFKKPVMKTASQLLAKARAAETVDIASVLYYLPPSISIPLKIQSKLVNEAILWIFIEQEKYLEHLKALKNYLLLKKAEFSLSLTNSVFEMSEDIKKPSLLLSSYTLNSILQRALSACSSKTSAKFERNLSFVVEDNIPEVFDPTDIQMLRCLSMRYVVKWPINVLITEPILKKYSRVFRFLIQLQRVSWVLKVDFREMKNLKQGKSIQYTQVQLYRHNMTQVIRLLKGYIMREALEQCWNDLVHRLTCTEIDLDELYMSHLKYINKIIQRCFLCEESTHCHKTILQLFGSVLKYHEALRKGSWRRNKEVNLLFHTNFRNLQTVYLEFGKNLDNFRSVLKILVYQKQKMYFEPLFLELNSNTKNETEL